MGSPYGAGTGHRALPARDDLHDLQPVADGQLALGELGGRHRLPLCSTTTLRGRSFCATRNASIVQGSVAGIGWPLAITVDSFMGSYAVSAASQSFQTGS